jgi:alkanesulfonate monooxygenase SsuD/methylene tetrahydromethanopterin reductase-like flavin-dependent oxidoreductase (luciferase family)
VNPHKGGSPDSSQISAVDYEGKYVSVGGPLNLPPSPQGHPVIIQAGDSPRGREFGARWGDVIFAIERTAADLRAKKDDLRSKAAAQGRDGSRIRLFAAVQPIIGETTAIAHARRDFLKTRITPAAGIEFFSLFARIDLSGVAPDFPGSFEDFGHAVVPHLQKLGVFRKDYTGTALRSHLGI